MADEIRSLPESVDDLPRRVRGVNWRVPGQTGAAPEFARIQRPRQEAGGQLPKRVPGTSAFRPAPRLVRVRSLQVAQHPQESRPKAPMPAMASGWTEPPSATSRPPAAMLPVRATVLPPAPPATAPRAQPPPASAKRPHAGARARLWSLAGLLLVIVATVAVLVVKL